MEPPIYTHDQYVDLTNITFRNGKFAILRRILLYLLSCVAPQPAPSRIAAKQFLIKREGNTNYNFAQPGDAIICFDYEAEEGPSVQHANITEENVESFNS